MKYLKESNFCSWAFVAQLVKNHPAIQETWVRSLDWEDLLEKEMAIHSSILAGLMCPSLLQRLLERLQLNSQMKRYTEWGLEVSQVQELLFLWNWNVTPSWHGDEFTNLEFHQISLLVCTLQATTISPHFSFPEVEGWSWNFQPWNTYLSGDQYHPKPL